MFLNSQTHVVVNCDVWAPSIVLKREPSHLYEPEKPQIILMHRVIFQGSIGHDALLLIVHNSR